MADLYIAVLCDRHRDPDPRPFWEPETAIAAARAWINDLGPLAVVEDNDALDDVLYTATYGDEGDFCFVVRREVHGDG